MSAPAPYLPPQRDPYHWDRSELDDFVRHLRPDQGQDLADSVASAFGILATGGVWEGFDPEAIDLGAAYLERVTRPIELTEEDEEMLLKMLGRERKAKQIPEALPNHPANKILPEGDIR